MEPPRMILDSIQSAFAHIAPEATTLHVREACNELFRMSDLYNLELGSPFDAGEVEAVGRAIWEFIVDPFNASEREIRFRVARCRVGERCTYEDFACTFSSECAYMAYARPLAELPNEALVRHVMACLIGVLYRYQTIRLHGGEHSIMYHVLVYIGGLQDVLCRSQRGDTLGVAIVAALRAMESLEELSAQQWRALDQLLTKPTE